ncbi:MAG: hypothetical protein MUP82_04105, partial [Candidatus Marinimicrobia bacterium]|nr:hypothetical protein [Candidatus Neomarinimicrobiota bacterium]
MSGPSLTLTVVPQQTSLDCSWSLSESSFTSISSAVLTYTDVSGNVWRTKNVSYEGRSVSRDSIVDLVSDTQYAVFLTLRGVLTGGTATTTLVSNTVINRTGKIPDRPLITLLSGPDYIQVLFTSEANIDPNGHSTDIGNLPYDFNSGEVKNVVVSYNQIRTGTGTHTGQTGARDFNVTNDDIKTHTFNDISGATMTYKYILLTDLSTDVDFEYEVAAVYYNDYGPGEVSATKKIGVNNTGDDTDSAQNKQFISYALNDAGDAVDELYPLGGSPIKINVNWNNPFLVTGDTLADLEMQPKSIQRLKWTNDVSGNDGALVTLTSGNYNKVDATYTYVDTGLDAGVLDAGVTYSYIITVETADGDATKTSETNKVVALTTTTVALAAANLVLDPLDGSITLDAAFTDIVTGRGGFSVNDFSNNDFKLVYQFVGGSEQEKTISIEDDRVSCDFIERTTQGELQYARIESKPVHNTVYIDSWGGDKTQSLYYIKNTDRLNLTGNYNTTFPQAVTGFSYTNATGANTATKSFELTWNDTDTTNDDSTQYYRVIATRNSDASLNIVLSLTDVTANVTADKYVTITGGRVAFNSGTDAFFETGNNYKFSIQRGYVHLNTITTKPSDSVVVDKVPSNELLYGAINSKEVDLIMFSNPPQPVISGFTFDENTGVLGFKLE